MSRCRCGHIQADHTAKDAGLFPTQRNTIAAGNECRRCDCTHFHTTTYKKRATAQTALHAAGRAKPPQMRLFERSDP